MTQEEIQALIDASLEANNSSLDERFKTHSQQLTSQITEATSALVTKATTGLAAKMSREIAALSKSSSKPKGKKEDSNSDGDEKDAKAEPSNLAVQALQTQLADVNKRLEQQAADLEAERKQAFTEASTTALVSAIADSNAQHQGLLRQVLATDYADKLKRDGDQWFVVDGDRTVGLADSVKAYLGTDNGKVFVPPSGVQGSGAKETPNDAPAPNAGKYSSRSEQILSEFASGEATLKIN